LVELNGPAASRAWAEAATPVKRPLETDGEELSSPPHSPDVIPKTPTHVGHRLANYQVPYGTGTGTYQSRKIYFTSILASSVAYPDL